MHKHLAKWKTIFIIAALFLGVAYPAKAFGLFDKTMNSIEKITGAGTQVPVLASENVKLIRNLPNELMVSSVFATDKPYMYANTLSGITVYDVTDSKLPLPVGHLPMTFFQNENVNLGEREDGSKFILVGFDLYGVTPTYDHDPSPGTKNEIAVVDVTDPTNPHIVSRLLTTTSTHTVSCVDKECTYAYTAGSNDKEGNPAFSIINLADYQNPFEEKTYPSSTGHIGHDWNIDESGVAWHAGWQGTVAYDITGPLNPQVLNGTDYRALNGEEWNTFIHHNTIRPDANAFRNGRAKGKITTTESTERTKNDISKGEVVLVTEEDWLHPGACQSEGSFQTWHIQEYNRKAGGFMEPGTGTIEPLDKWNSTILDTSIDTKPGFICSAHYFDYHQDGFVSIGFYQLGTRILDVRDPSDIKQIGYWFSGIQESWGAKWVPERDETGHVTGKMTNIVYVKDPTRGIDILEVTLPATEPGKTKPVKANISLENILVTPDLLSPALQQKIQHNLDKAAGNHHH